MAEHLNEYFSSVFTREGISSLQSNKLSSRGESQTI